MIDTCTIEACDKNVYARAWCRRHYMRWWHRGQPEVRTVFKDRNCRVCGVLFTPTCATNKDCSDECRDEKRRELHKPQQNAYGRMYHRNNPVKVKARLLARANRSKIKKSNCEHCGGTRLLDMHHPDYSKPLDVITLCRSCHSKVHKNQTIKNMEKK